jgi:hypothetical protein
MAHHTTHPWTRTAYPHDFVTEFIRRVDVRSRRECWPWRGPVDSSGYGAVSAPYSRTNPRRITKRAHRVSYEMAHGPIPDGLVIRHKCDNPVCVSPYHLEVGTYADNARDHTLRGKPHQRVSANQIIEMRIRYTRGESIVWIASKMGLSYQTVHRHVKPTPKKGW